MIHDATVEVTCDGMLGGRGCHSSIFVALHAGTRDSYSARDRDIESGVEHEGWIVRDCEHFCCEECAEQQTVASEPAE